MYQAALNQTGRAYHTLTKYKQAAKEFPLEKRAKALSFTHHYEILRLPVKTRDEVMAAKAIPAEKRIAALSFTHHLVIVPLEEQTRNEVLEELADQADKGLLPTKEEVRIKVQKLTPRKKKKATQKEKRASYSARPL
jgi:hypothetical protein